MLIIDDNSTNRLILREVLSAQGALVSEAHGGAEGIQVFREASRTGQDYAVVITDCHMPEVDGFAVVEALRTAGGSCKTILMVSSSQLSSDMSTASALGIGAYLIKPVKSVELIKAINVAMLKTLDETQDRIVITRHHLHGARKIYLSYWSKTRPITGCSLKLICGKRLTKSRRPKMGAWRCRSSRPTPMVWY